MSSHSCSQVLELYLGLTWDLLRTYCESIDVGLLTISPERIPNASRTHPERIPNASRTHRCANRLMKIEIALQFEKPWLQYVCRL